MLKKTFVVVVGVVAGASVFAVAKQDMRANGMGPERSAFRHQQVDQMREHRMDQKAENIAFRESLKGMTPEQREAAIREHNAQQQAENKAFRAKQHEENMAFMKERLAANKNLTDAQKEELITFLEGQYKENVAFREQQQQETVAFFQKIAADTTLTQVQRKQAIKDFLRQQQAENRAHRKEQKTERTAELQKLRAGTDTTGTTTGDTTDTATGTTAR